MPQSHRRSRSVLKRTRPLLEALEERLLLAAPYVVTSAADSGAGTLRDAITQLNVNNPAYTTEVDFNIAGSGVHTISPLSALPIIIRDNYSINGLTQPGSRATTPLIQLDGASAGNDANGLDSQALHGEMLGLIISDFSFDGIILETGASATSILNCFIGTNASGTAAQGNGNAGIEVETVNNLIGTAGARNVISGNATGVQIDGGATGNFVLGNYIGTNAAGNAALANGFNGISDFGSSNTIGGTSTSLRNVISGNAADGIYLGPTASADQVLGNYVGLNANRAALGNGTNGVEVDGVNNTIGGTSTSQRNVISGNAADGIYLGQTASADQVLGNYVGLNANRAALGNGTNGVEVDGVNNTIGGTTTGASNSFFNNGGDGILLDSGGRGTTVEGNNVQKNTLNGVEIASSFNALGYTTAAARNIIVLNGQDGVMIDSGATNNTEYDDFIGTASSGSAAAANGNNGVEIAGSNNTIGFAVGPHVLISGNAGDGILLDSGATGNLVQGGYVGINFAGTAALANGGNGVEVDGVNNTIGYASRGGRNVISGNVNDGILLGSSVTGDLVLGNYVGTNAAGSAAVANSGNGVEIFGTSNTVGGTSAVNRNLISGNAVNGIALGSSANNNVVLGNYIGTNASGGSALGNRGNGVEVLSSYNTIGGTAAGSRNIISANAQDGVLLDSSAFANTVLGNLLGTNVSGALALGNSSNGVEVLGSFNTIGGTSYYARNIISGNLFNGVALDSGASYTALQGNFIGLTFGGAAALGNSGNGVEVDGVNNTVGGAGSTARNVISGNFLDGVYIAHGASGVAVQGNYIGTNNAGTAALGNGTGVEVGANGTLVGGTSTLARNIISGNQGDGVDIDSGVSGAVVQGDYIGTDVTGSAALGNGAYGVNIAGNHTLVGGSVAADANIIANNATAGVDVSAGSSNTVRRNSIYANGPSHVGPGIVLASGANKNLVAPTISTVTLSGNILTVTGSFSVTAGVTYVLEFLVSPAGDPEGKIYVGSKTVTPATTGTETFNFKASTSAATSTTLITATLTDASGDTSAFSNGVTS
jgi:hypothetical protein